MKTNYHDMEHVFRQYPTYKSWKRIGIHPRFGSLIHLPSLISKRNQGVGDFADLPAFARFSRSIGASIIQLLPINDMGRGKTPYSSISAFALDPVYIALDWVSEIVDNPSQSIREFLDKNNSRIEEFKQTEAIPFDEIRSMKMGIMYLAYRDFIERNKYSNSPRWQEFMSYVQDNRYWIWDYAIFRTMKHFTDWKSWVEWDYDMKVGDPQVLGLFVHRHEDEIYYQMFVQWVAWQQMKQARNMCREQGVIIKGDIPLLVDHQSADVWAHPHYFKQELCAGAPPDQYAERGQNWGSPPYNWYNMQKDNFVLWRERLRYAQNFYDIFRIDHIVGIFRIWTIDLEKYDRGEKSGWDGNFDPSDERYWGNQGQNLLSMMVESTDMLPIGEDLGTIPPVCRKTMRDLGIPGYKVIIWERDWGNKEHGMPFYHPNDYPYLSMSTTTTHDFWTLVGWWCATDPHPVKEKDNENGRKTLWSFFGGEQPRPREFPFRIYKAVLDTLFYGNSMFLILPFTDLWGVVPGVYGEDYQKDRINDPDNPERPQNWNGRMPLSLEDFPRHPEIANKMEYIRNLAQNSGRGV